MSWRFGATVAEASGAYQYNSSAQLTGQLTLDAESDSDAQRWSERPPPSEAR